MPNIQYEQAERRDFGVGLCKNCFHALCAGCGLKVDFPDTKTFSNTEVGRRNVDSALSDAGWLLFQNTAYCPGCRDKAPNIQCLMKSLCQFLSARDAVEAE
jgi:hypothetical protein